MNRYSLVILIVSVLIVAVSVWKGDWNWLIVAIIGIAVVCAPMRVMRDSSAGYDEHLMGIAVIPLVAFIVLFSANLFFNFQYFRPVSISIQACTSMAFGLMIAVFLNARTEISLSWRWTVLFSLIFACSLSVLNLFFTVFWMGSMGYPLYNGDFNNTLENNQVNLILMLPLVVTTLSTFIYGIIFREYLKRAGSVELSRLLVGGRI